MKTLTLEDILSADDMEKELVEVPEWNGSVYISTMTAEDRDSFESSVSKLDGGKTQQDLKNIRAKLVARCAVNEQGERLFDEKNVAGLGKKSAKALDRLFDVASRINGISEEHQVELAKNS